MATRYLLLTLVLPLSVAPLSASSAGSVSQVSQSQNSPPVTRQLTSDSALPEWWNQWAKGASFKSAFTQEGESAAFGKLTRKGTIQIAKGGRLRAEYDKGILLVSNGRQFSQYDPSTRTAQRFDIEEASAEWPLLRLLTDPSALTQVFRVLPHSSGKIKLLPKNATQSQTALPEIFLEGKGTFLHRAEWVDATGAKQVLTLVSPKKVPDPGDGHFTLKVPEGTKWIQ